MLCVKIIENGSQIAMSCVENHAQGLPKAGEKVVLPLAGASGTDAEYVIDEVIWRLPVDRRNDTECCLKVTASP